MHEYTKTRMLGYKNAKAQTYKDTRINAYKRQGYNNPRIQEYKNTRIHNNTQEYDKIHG